MANPKYNVGDILMLFYQDKGEPKIQEEDIVILKVPPFKHEDDEVISDKYLVYDDGDGKKLNQLISIKTIEDERYYKKKKI